MHWIEMLLLAWLSLGLATVASLFWLCKRTAETVKDPANLGSPSPQRAELGASDLSSELRSA